MQNHKVPGSHSRKIKIRAHHLLCLQGFQGYGYSPNFIKNMADIIATLKASPKTKIILTTKLDNFCTPCPHNQNNTCQKDPQAQERITLMDQNVLKKLELDENTTDQFDTLIDLANDKLKTIQDVKEICGYCEWRKDCLWYQKLKS